MSDKRKLLVHIQRITQVVRRAIKEGPDGSLEGKFAAEHPIFIHSILGSYLAGILGYLESEDGSYSWNISGVNYNDFDQFTANYPAPPKQSAYSNGITKASITALAQIRNAIIHNGNDLSKNNNTNSPQMVINASLPGVVLAGSIVTLEEPFLYYVRSAALAVRYYHGDV